MGMFDYYGDAQLKVGDDLACRDFQVGDEVPIPDGVYLDWEYVVVVHDGRLVRVDSHLFTKWGDRLSPEIGLRVIEDRKL